MTSHLQAGVISCGRVRTSCQDDRGSRGVNLAVVLRSGQDRRLIGLVRRCIGCLEVGLRSMATLSMSGHYSLAVSALNITSLACTTR